MPPDATARWLQALQRIGRRRIPLDQLRTTFARACPELAEQPDRRIHLAGVIQRAADQNAIVLPRSRSAWDGNGGTSLPAFVTLATPRPDRPAVLPPDYAWHPLLAFAVGERNPLRLEVLKSINEWLRTAPDLALIVPIKERSLEIFGDEKRLDRLRGGTTALFDGKLPLAALSCRICPIPLPYEPGSERARGRPVLIVENNDTWASFCGWNRVAARYAAVAYAGGGNAKGLAYDETFLDELLAGHGASELLYFGDLDPAGLRIAAGAARRRAARGGVPLLPAESLYSWLLKHGRRTALDARERASADDLAWLPPDLRGEAEKVFWARQRIPQESVGTRALMNGMIEP